MVKIVVFAALILLFILFGVLVFSVLTLEAAAQEEAEDIEEICEACMWRDAGGEKACRQCLFRANKD